jgi:hypothetical protein
MGIYEGNVENMKCKDCYCELTVDQYRRKVPRCDECHQEAMFFSTEMDAKVLSIAPEGWVEKFRRDLANWSRKSKFG